MTTAAYHRFSGGHRLWFLAIPLAITAAVVVVPAAQTIWLAQPAGLPALRTRCRHLRRHRSSRAILQDEVFWISLWHSAIWIVGVVGLQFLLGLVTALLLNQSFWWRGAARALVVIPWALPSVIIGLMWTWMYDFQCRRPERYAGAHGDHRRAGRLAGARPDLALAAIMAALVWQGFLVLRRR